MSSYGILLKDYSLQSGVWSVITKGTLTAQGTTTINKSDYANVQQWRVFFTPVGVRDITAEEIRPYWTETSTQLRAIMPAGAGTHQVTVLGR